MNEQEFIKVIRDLYLKSRDLIHYSHEYKLQRGLSHSISGATEDLFGVFIAKHLDDKDIELWVDKNISINLDDEKRVKSFRPDLFIIKNNVMTHYFDLKMDLGWSRNLKDYLSEKESFISDIKAKSTSWYTDSKKRRDFSKFLPY